MGLRADGSCIRSRVVFDVTWWQYALIALGVLAVSGLAGMYLGMAMDTHGSDDRDDTQPADLWQGRERRKVRAGAKPTR